MHTHLFRVIWVITLAAAISTARASGQEPPSPRPPENLPWPKYQSLDWSADGAVQNRDSANGLELPGSSAVTETAPLQTGTNTDVVPYFAGPTMQPDDWPTRGVSVFVGYDAWRGTSDGGWENNGIHAGANFGSRLGRFSDWTGIGGQLGGSMGAFNWSGTDYRMSHQDESQPQGFLTYGLFRKARDDSKWNAALVHDWMFNSNYSVFAVNPTLAQWRAQLGYAVNASNEFGVWGTWRLLSDTRQVNFFGPVTWRPLGQFNPYWHHKWEAGGADTWLWIGLPERDRLTGTGSLGDYIAGAAANCPLSERVSLYTLVTYMHPSASAGPVAAREDAWNFTIGISFYPARNARSTTVSGQTWMPLMPVANNGYFLVDASHNY